MANARKSYEEILLEIESYGRPSAVEERFRWSAEYLTRRAVFYQFSGGCHGQVLSGEGRRFDEERGTVTLIPCQLAAAALSDFAHNEEVAFYTGESDTISTIAREVVQFSVQTPEVLIIHIETEDPEPFNQVRSLTRLAFVGLGPSFTGLSPTMPCESIMTTGDLFHPFWCRDRRQITRLEPSRSF